jgi:hypothetical protein
MTSEELDLIGSWDRRCGDNEATFFPVTIARSDGIAWQHYFA